MKRTSLILCAALAGCAGGTIGVGGFGGNRSGGVGVGVTVPIASIGNSQQRFIDEGQNPIRPGMSRSEVMNTLGEPYWFNPYAGVTVLNYRMRPGSCLIHEVRLSNDVVQTAGEVSDPACR